MCAGHRRTAGAQGTAKFRQFHEKGGHTQSCDWPSSPRFPSGFLLGGMRKAGPKRRVLRSPLKLILSFAMGFDGNA